MRQETATALSHKSYERLNFIMTVMRKMYLMWTGHWCCWISISASVHLFNIYHTAALQVCVCVGGWEDKALKFKWRQPVIVKGVPGCNNM